LSLKHCSKERKGGKGTTPHFKIKGCNEKHDFLGLIGAREKRYEKHRFERKKNGHQTRILARFACFNRKKKRSMGARKKKRNQRGEATSRRHTSALRGDNQLGKEGGGAFNFIGKKEKINHPCALVATKDFTKPIHRPTPASRGDGTVCKNWGGHGGLEERGDSKN